MDAFQKVEGREFSAWDLASGADEAKKELRERFLIVRTRGFGKVLNVDVPEHQFAKWCRGLEWVRPEKLLEIFDLEKGMITEDSLTEYHKFCKSLYSFHRWTEALRSDDFAKPFTEGLSGKEEIKFFREMIRKNREEKVSLLTDKQRIQYRKAWVKVYEQLPSDRFDNFPQVIGLAAADPFTLMDNVKRYGAKETAKGVAQWFNAEREKFQKPQKPNRKAYEASLVVRALGAASAMPTAVFVPNLTPVARGILGACAVASGWLTFAQLRKHCEEIAELKQKEQIAKPHRSPVAVTLAKYTPQRG